MKKAMLVSLICCLIICTSCGKKEAQTKTQPEQTSPKIESSDSKADQPSSKPEQTKPPKESDSKSSSDTKKISGSDLEKKVNRFNELEDGDPDKEALRKELQDLFESAEAAQAK